MIAGISPHPPIDFLAIGHVCYDLVAGGRLVGGAAAYGASTAAALGLRAGILTSGAEPDAWRYDLPGIAVHQTRASATTTFENTNTTYGRVQTIHEVAAYLTGADVVPQWRRTPMVFLGPIANEVDPDMIGMFSNSMIAVGPQGWTRRWNDDGRIFHVGWDSADFILPLAAVACISRHDLVEEAAIKTFARLANVLVVTNGRQGCIVHYQGEARAFLAPEAMEVDATGAGDIFAAAYLIRLYQTRGDLWEAAEFANRIAAISVAHFGLPAKVNAIRQMTQLESGLLRGREG